VEPIKPPKIMKVYTLIKQSGLTLTYIGFSTASVSVGTGFFLTQTEAELHRTIELLKDTTSPRPLYHVFELEIPNPAYQE
jgi:hypothetical protein